MYKLVKGDLLKANVDVICHQVNLQGYMGGGLALAIARNFPDVKETYINFRHKKLGEVCFAKTDKFVIANCFSQKRNFDTHYEALEQCVRTVKGYMDANGLKTIAIPYKYGCGIANGNWSIVLSIFESMFDNLTVYIKE